MSVQAKPRRWRAGATTATVIAVAVAAAVVLNIAVSGGVSRAVKPNESRPASYHCVVEATNPQPPHLVNLCHWDASRGEWVRQYHGRTVDARTVPKQPALMCEWLGCPPTAHRKHG